MEKTKGRFSLVGKYRDIAIAAGLFVVFDLFVLILNFYTSFEIAADATAINLAGRQRMLSQRMTKSLLQIKSSESYEDRDKALDELDKTYTLFGKTFNAFYKGGQTVNTDGTTILLEMSDDSNSQAILKEAEKIWTPIQARILTFIEDKNNVFALNSALGLANENNLKLLSLMNKLTTHLASLARDKAERLRMFQTAGITLALINFGFLLFHFIRKLGKSDAATEEARQETEEILTTVGEGFFLLDQNLNLGHKHSKAMEKIFQKEIIPGSPFLNLFEGKVSAHTLDMTKEYINLLFKKRIRENLATTLNPLVRLEIDLSKDSTRPDIHYLNISFKRVKSETEITHVLGSVMDITEQVKLEQSLEAAENRAKEEIELLSQILQNDPLQISDYLQSTRKLLLSINSYIEHSKSPSDLADIVNQSLPAIHQVKGDASTLGSELFASLAHDFENILKTLQYNTELTTEDMLPVVVHINQMQAKISTVSQIIDKITRIGEKQQASKQLDRSTRFEVDLKNLADKVSRDLQKKVNLVVSQINFNQVDENAARHIRNICIQITRNAIAHGIELPEERKAAAKPAYGTVSISVIAEPDQTSLVIKDDGSGLNLNKIKRAILESGRLTKKQLLEMDDRSVIMQIFNSGISTAEELDQHSGQGIGLTIVKQAIKELDGNMFIGYRSGQYTEFRFVFSNVAVKQFSAEVVA